MRYRRAVLKIDQSKGYNQDKVSPVANSMSVMIYAGLQSVDMITIDHRSIQSHFSRACRLCLLLAVDVLVLHTNASDAEQLEDELHPAHQRFLTFS